MFQDRLKPFIAGGLQKTLNLAYVLQHNNPQREPKGTLFVRIFYIGNIYIYIYIYIYVW